MTLEGKQSQNIYPTNISHLLTCRTVDDFKNNWFERQICYNLALKHYTLMSTCPRQDFTVCHGICTILSTISGLDRTDILEAFPELRKMRPLRHRIFYPIFQWISGYWWDNYDFKSIHKRRMTIEKILKMKPSWH